MIAPIYNLKSTFYMCNPVCVWMCVYSYVCMCVPLWSVCIFVCVCACTCAHACGNIRHCWVSLHRNTVCLIYKGFSPACLFRGKGCLKSPKSFVTLRETGAKETSKPATTVTNLPPTRIHLLIVPFLLGSIFLPTTLSAFEVGKDGLCL